MRRMPNRTSGNATRLACHVASLATPGHERWRWVKDGPLPKSSTGQFRKGRQVFQFYLHPAEEIAKIAENPQIVAKLRKADRKKIS
jgi:hypothetical protein